MDKFTLDIIEAGLVAAADEMFAVMKRTAMSPIIYEILDVGTGITDAKGDLVSSGAGIPTFVGVLDKAVKAILAKHPSPKEGDIYVTNDPNFGGVTHLNDVVLCQPLFADGALAAWAASIAHWSDVGGRTPGSMSTKATEIFQEGLRLPAVKIVDEGKPIQGMFDIISVNSRMPKFAQGDLWAQIAASVNSRMPKFAQGDLWAQIAAGRRAEMRIKSIVSKFGMKAYLAAIDRAFQLAEARILEGLSKIPEGRYEIEGAQDSGELWRIAIEVRDKTFTVDLREAPAEDEGPFNTCRDGAVISSQMILKNLCDPTLGANQGSYRPLKVLTRKGSKFDANEGAAHGYYFEVRIALFDLLWKCLAQNLPDLLPSGHFASICGTVIAGTNPFTGQKFTMVEPQQGGWGATKTRNGMSAMYSTSHGETFNCPAEICEARYGLTVREKSLGNTPVESTNWRGGFGVKTVYEMGSPSVISTGFTHARVPVWSVNGGAEGGVNMAWAVEQNNATREVPVTSDLHLNKGDALVIETAFGGGR